MANTESEHAGDAPAGGTIEGVEPGYSRDSELSILFYVNALLRSRWHVLALAVGGGLLAVGVTFLLPVTFTSTASFVPQMPGNQGPSLGGLAARLGLQGVMAQGGRPPEFYAELLDSESLLRDAVLTKYPSPIRESVEGRRTRESLIELLEVEGQSETAQVAKARQWLRGAVDVTTDNETGLVEIDVTTQWPEVSVAVARRLIELIHEFNTETRQSQASEERIFLSRRAAEAREELHAAEDSLRRFLERNRSYRSSPTLRFEFERLQRQVDLRQQVHTSLAQSLEEAKIEEVRSTPLVTVVDQPEEPASPDDSHTLMRFLLGVTAGTLAAVLWVLINDTMGSARSEAPDEFAEFHRLLLEAKRDIERLAGRLTTFRARH